MNQTELDQVVETITRLLGNTSTSERMVVFQRVGTLLTQQAKQREERCKLAELETSLGEH